MVWQFFIVLLAVGVSIASPSGPQKASTAGERPTGVPEQYAGNWVCQTSQPGYNITPPHADPSQPLTNKITTTTPVMVLKLSLNADGTYETANSKGHYTFDSTTKGISWLDGPHKSTMTKTQIGKRDNGAPKMGFVFNKRYYGCFMPKREGK